MILTLETIVKSIFVILIVLALAPPAFAGACKQSIIDLQVRIDAAIERQARTGDWKPESLAALRNNQPTPGSIAATEGRKGVSFQAILDTIDRARAADRRGSSAACGRELAQARSLLRKQRR